MSYTIQEVAGGIIQFDTSGPAHAYRFQGDITLHGRLAARPMAYSPATTATNGIAASNATVSPALTGTDFAGFVVIGTSANSVAGAEVNVVFGQPYPSLPTISITEANPSTAGSNLYAAASTNSFTVFTGVAPANSGTLAFFYTVLGS